MEILNAHHRQNTWRTIDSMPKKMRKEKFTSVQKKGNSTFILVKFTYKVGDQRKTYTKTFNVADYPSYSECLKAACKHRDIKRAELLTGFVPEAEMTCDELIDIYKAKKHLASSTAKAFDANYQKYIQPEYGNRNVAGISPLEIEDSLNALTRTCSQNVIDRLYNIWGSIFSTARKLRVITINPMEEVDKPKSRYFPEERTAKATTDEDIQALINALLESGRTEKERYDHTILAYMVILVRQTGMRPQEVTAVCRSNIDLDNRIIRVDRTYGSDESGRAIVGAKTATSVRNIPLTETAVNALQHVMNMSANEYIFMRFNGKLFTSEHIAGCFRDMRKKYGLNPVSLYTLRHQFSSDLITANVDPRSVMELMGHSNVSTTLSVYARSNAETKRNAVEEIGRRFYKIADE